MAWDGCHGFIEEIATSSHIYRWNFTTISPSQLLLSHQFVHIQTWIRKYTDYITPKKVFFVLGFRFCADAAGYCVSVNVFCLWVGKSAMFEWKKFIRENRWMKHSFTCGWHFVPGGFGTAGLITKRPSIQFYNIYIIYIF